MIESSELDPHNIVFPDESDISSMVFQIVKMIECGQNQGQTSISSVLSIIMDTVASIAQPVLRRAVDNFVRRIERCTAARGGIFETND